MFAVLEIFLTLFFGASLGSFACASVWRLKSFQLRSEKDLKDSILPQEKKLIKFVRSKSLISDRSVCLGCGHSLAWYDLIPFFSWVVLRGKCRYCQSKIGLLEFLSEVLMALVFLFSYLYWPFSLDSAVNYSLFLVWLVASVLLCIVFIYDMKWYEIPSIVSYSLIGLGLIFMFVNWSKSNFSVEFITSAIGSIAILSGIYLVIFFTSKGNWIGFGDIILGFGLALFLLKWEYALICLFLANFIGSLVVLPAMVFHKLSKKSRVPFGPFLIIGFLITFFYGSQLVDILIPRSL